MIIPRVQYLKNLPKKRTAVGCLFFNSQKELLILRTSYSDNWNISGGCLNEGESLIEGLKREIKEEINVKFKIKKCLIIDSKREIVDNYVDESLQFIFLGKDLNKEDVAKIKVDDDEIIEFRFINLKKSLESLNPKMTKRIKSLKNNFEQCILTENGERIL